MKYFAIGVQGRNLDIPEITNCNEAVKFEHRKPGNTYLLPYWNLLKVASSPETLFVDYLSYPVPLFSEALWEVVNIYEPELNHKKFVLYNMEQGHSALYYHPLIPVITEQPHRLSRTIISEQAGGSSLFMAGDMTKNKVCMRLDLIESIFRRDLIGIEAEELDLDGKQGEKKK